MGMVHPWGVIQEVTQRFRFSFLPFPISPKGWVECPLFLVVVLSENNPPHTKYGVLASKPNTTAWSPRPEPTMQACQRMLQMRSRAGSRSFQ